MLLTLYFTLLTGHRLLFRIILRVGDVRGRLTPLVLGNRFRIDPLLVFAWLVFWSWLWGAAGAVVASPMLVLVKLVCEMSHSLGPLADFMTGGPEPSAPVAESVANPAGVANDASVPKRL